MTTGDPQLLGFDRHRLVELLDHIAAFTSRWTLDRRGHLRQVDRNHPRPLYIDGHEYARRRRNRRRS